MALHFEHCHFHTTAPKVQASTQIGEVSLLHAQNVMMTM